MQLTSFPHGYKAIIVGARGDLGNAFCQHIEADHRAAALYDYAGDAMRVPRYRFKLVRNSDPAAPAGTTG